MVITKPKILIILGPTASGKSDLAVRIAKLYNGEIISADSRQVFTGLDIGTGKITEKEMRGIPHHLLDVVNAKKRFNVSEYKILAEESVDQILAKRKLPIICGGTGFYISAVVDNLILPDVPPNLKLRKQLEKKSVEELVAILKKLDTKKLESIDQKNPRRLIRAIEITKALGNVPKIDSKPKYNVLQIGTKISDKELRNRITKRLYSRIKIGMIEEAKNLHKSGLSWKRMNELGLEYRYLALYLQNKITKEEMAEQLINKIWQYSRRQITWFKRDKRIKWLSPENLKRIDSKIKKFLSK